MPEDSLLDVFVNVGQRGLVETNELIKQFAIDARKAFGDAGEAQAKAAKKGADAQVVAAKRAAEAVTKAAQRAADAQSKISAGLQKELLRFQRDKSEIAIGVRLVANPDISREFANIQSKVAKETASFREAPGGKSGNEQRANSLREIVRLRTDDLTVLYEQIAAETQLNGLDAGGERKAASLRAATEASDQFALSLREVGQLVQNSGSTDLKSQYQEVNNEVLRLRKQLATAVGTSDLIGAEKAKNDLLLIGERVENIKKQASERIPINVDAKALKQEFGNIRKEFESANKLLSYKTSGSLNFQQKLDVAGIEKNMRDIVIQFNRLDQITEKTAANFAEMTNLVNRFKETSQQVSTIQGKIETTSLSTNQLSNNAYQMGQAFEDAAVGFSLNGITGAVRGASNNINFLINNLAQAGTLTTALGAKTAAMVPLYAGIGTAALFILPALYKWIKTLSDIEGKTRDLSDLMKRDLSDIQFNVSLLVDSDSAIRAVRDAENAAKAVEEVIKQASEGKKLTMTLSTELSQLSERQVSADLDKQLKQLEVTVGDKLRNVSVDRFLVRGAEGDVDVIKADPEEVQRVSNLEAALRTLQKARDQLFANADRNIVSAGEIETTRDSLRLLVDGFKGLIGYGDLTAEEMERVGESLKEAQGEFEKFNEKAQEIRRINADLFGPVLDAALEKTKKLSREYQFQKKINEGTATEGERFLFTLREQEFAQKRTNERLLDSLGINSDSLSLIKKLNSNFNEEQRIDLLKQINSLERERQKTAESSEEALLSATKRRLDIQQRISDLLNEQVKSTINKPGFIDRVVHSADRTKEKRLEDLQQDLIDAQDKEAKELAKATEAIKKLTDQIALMNRQLNGPQFAPEVPGGAGVAGNPARGALIQRQAEQDRALKERDKRKKEFDERRRFDEEVEKKQNERIAQKEAEKAKEEELKRVEKAREDEIKKMVDDAAKRDEKIKKDREEAKRSLEEELKLKEEMSENDKKAAQAAKEAAEASRKETEEWKKRLPDVLKQLELAKEDARLRVEEARKRKERFENLNDPLKRAAELKLINEETRKAEQEQAQRDRKNIEDANAALEQQARDQIERDKKVAEQKLQEAILIQNEINKINLEGAKGQEEVLKRLTEQAQKLRREALFLNTPPQAQFRPETPQFAPEDPSGVNQKQLGEAQAQANARAMENTNFTSTTLQTLIATSNELLGRMNENVTKIDASSRYA